MITKEDVIEVAKTMGQELTQEQVEEVIATYDEKGCDSTWEMTVEWIINDMLYA